MTRKITLRYRTVDRFTETRTFATLAGAQKRAWKRMGRHPDVGTSYAVSFDGVATLHVEGATLDEIFPAETNGPRSPYESGVTDDRYMRGEF